MLKELAVVVKDFLSGVALAGLLFGFSVGLGMASAVTLGVPLFLGSGYFLVATWRRDRTTSKADDQLEHVPTPHN